MSRLGVGPGEKVALSECDCFRVERRHPEAIHVSESSALCTSAARIAINAPSRSGTPDPQLGRGQTDGESQPEGNAEEMVRREVGEATGGEGDSHDRADGGDGQPEGVALDYPSAVFGDAAGANGNERLAESEQEQQPEREGGGGFQRAADRHLRAHDQSRNADYQPAGEKDASCPAMQLEMAPAQARHELKRTEHNECQPRNNMRQREQRMAREAGVEIHGGRPQMEDSPRRHYDHDQRQERDQRPERSGHQTSRSAVSGSTRVAHRAGR